jgi:hypothetical protein
MHQGQQLAHARFRQRSNGALPTLLIGATLQQHDSCELHYRCTITSSHLAVKTESFYKPQRSPLCSRSAASDQTLGCSMVLSRLEWSKKVHHNQAKAVTSLNGARELSHPRTVSADVTFTVRLSLIDISSHSADLKTHYYATEVLHLTKPTLGCCTAFLSRLD